MNDIGEAGTIMAMFQHLNVKENNTHFDSSVQFNVDTDRIVAQLEYTSAIGSMNYIIHYNRPHIVFILCKLRCYTIKTI